MYQSIQAARGAAAVLVVLFHLGYTLSLPKNFANPNIFKPFVFGASGVEFFFVLSGFIIMTAHYNEIGQANRLLRFLTKRAIRIYPIYWVIFIAVFIVGWFTPSLQHEVDRSGIVIAKSLLLVPQLPGIIGGTGAPIIIVAWTLQLEIVFYLVFSCLIINKKLGSSIIFLLLINYFASRDASNESSILAYLARDYLILFALGSITAYACLKNHFLLSCRYRMMLFSGLILFFATAASSVFSLQILSEYNTLFYGFASSAIIIGLVGFEMKGSVIGESKIFQLVGNASYSIYLTHFPVIAALTKAVPILGLSRFGFMGLFFSFVSILIVTLLSGIITHLLIEMPILNFLQKNILNKKIFLSSRP